MDFFSSKPLVTSLASESSDDPFANAIRERFRTTHDSFLTARLASPADFSCRSSNALDPFQRLSLVSDTSRSLSSTTLPRILPKNPPSSPPPVVSAFEPITPLQLPNLLVLPSTLLIDLRPPSAFDARRLHQAISLSVPSTLLRRPRVSLAQLAAMMPPTRDTSRFLHWVNFDTVIVLDLDTNILSENSSISSLLRKFKAENFSGNLHWIKGGFSAVLRAAQLHSGISALITDVALVYEEDQSVDNEGALQVRNLPPSAFQQSSTTVAGQRSTASPSIQPRDRKISEGSHAAPAPSSSRPMVANPFYDNIRQFSELSHGITAKIPLMLPDEINLRVKDLPFAWLHSIATQDVTVRAEALAMQFYKIEISEQRRLMGIMEQHSKQDQTENAFPFSITAAIEKGSKNRHQNIWPFEHARVHLNNRLDYINASFVQPLCTSKRYIATQGPLSDTLADFWSLVWEQDVRVIVMLTKRFEGSSVKCETYWPIKLGSECQFGQWTVTGLSYSTMATELDAERSHGESVGFDFGGSFSSHTKEPRSESIARRVFRLTNSDDLQTPSREILHFQFLDWPDHDVPSDPSDLLQLVKEVDAASASSGSVGSPVLLHCSAGVGRTGSYILIDAVLSAISDELQAGFTNHIGSQISSTHGMDLDALDTSHLGMRSTASDIGKLSSETIAPISEQNVAVDESTTQSQTTSFRNESRPILIRRRVSERLNLRALSLKLSRSDCSKPLHESSSSGDEHSVGQQSATQSSSGSFETSSSLLRDSATYSTLATTRASSGIGLDDIPSSPAFDYLPPRLVDANSQPSVIPLSLLNEPIREVLESMRGQRMSLCQTLRQYVFAHLAILLGSLQIVDELKNQRDPKRHFTGVPLEKRPSVKRRDRSDSYVEGRQLPERW